MGKASKNGRQNHHYSVYGYDQRLLLTPTVTGFNGETFDAVSACYLLGLGYRAYSPTLRRFLSTDSWSPFGQGGLNSYSYCAGDPLNRHDPTGHMYKSTIYTLPNRKRFRVTQNSAVAMPPEPVTVHNQPGPSQSRAATISNPPSYGPKVRELISQFNGQAASGHQSHVEARTLPRPKSAPPVRNSQQSPVSRTPSPFSRDSTPVLRTPSPERLEEMPYPVRVVVELRQRGLDRTISEVKAPSDEYPKAPRK